MKTIADTLSKGALARAIFAGVLMFVLATAFIELTRLGGRIASVWLANGAVLAILLRAPRKQWVPIFAAVFSANVAANLVSRDGVAQALVLSAANLVEIAMVAAVMRPRLPITEFARLHSFLPFIGATLVAPLFSGAIAVTYLAGGLDIPALLQFRTWYLSDLLGLLIVTPLAFSLTGQWTRPRNIPVMVESVAILFAVTAVTALVFSQSAPTIFMPLPLLLLAGLRLPAISAALVAVASGAIAIALTASGSGPVAASAAPLETKIFLVQAYVVTAFFLTMPVSALTHQRNSLDNRLRDRERQFRMLAEASPGGILHCDRVGRPMFLNRRWTELTGRTMEEVRALGWEAIVAKSERERARAIWDRAREAGNEAKICLPCPIFGSDDGWADIYITPELDGHDQIVGWVIRFLDASDRIRWSSAVEESESHYRLLADNSQDMIIRLDADGVQTYVSAAGERLLDHSTASMIGEPLMRYVHPLDRARVIDAMAFARRGEQQMASFRMLCDGGGERWVEAAFHAIENDGAGRHELVASVRDIDRRYHAEQVAEAAARKTRESNRLLRMAEEMAEVGHWHADLEGRSLSLSPSAERIVGLKQPATITPALALAMVEPSERTSVLRMVVGAMRGKPTLERQVTLRRASDGERRVLRMALHGERHEDGESRAIFAVIHDVTDRVADERRLRKALDKAEEAAEAKSAFLATMSHEIRTPMTGVLGMIELLHGELGEDERQAYLATLKQSADLLMAVLNDILDFSKMDHGSLELCEQPIELSGLIKSTADLFRNAASRKGLVFQARIEPGPAWVIADAQRLQQVVSNLVNNAIKFTDRGIVELGVDRVAVGDVGERWRVEVRDSGIGIDPEQVEKLFDPFAQADLSNRRRYGGTGLGLAICRRLVEAMGGEIGVDSAPGKGSTFWFEVELESASPVREPLGRPSTAPAQEAPLDILVAEDNPVNQLLVTSLLRRLGHRSTCVANGVEAIAAAEANAFDCILMDMQMPEMDGVGATRAIRTSGGPCATVPIIALTADAAPERRRFYDNVGLTDFMTKPIDSDRLAAKLADIAGERDRAGGVCAGEATGELLDAVHLGEVRGALGDDRFGGLIDLFAKELDERPPEIRAHLVAAEWKLVRAQAHSFKGASLSIGAHRLAAAAMAIEEADEGLPTKEREALAEQLVEVAGMTGVALERFRSSAGTLAASA